jgi:hypothetical protein
MATLTTDVSGHIITMVYHYRDPARRGHGSPDAPFRILLSGFLDLWKADRLTFACDPECHEAHNTSSFSVNADPKAGEGVVYNAFVVDIGTPDAIGWLQRDVPDTVKATLESRGPVQWLKQGGDLVASPAQPAKRARVAEGVVVID